MVLGKLECYCLFDVFYDERLCVRIKLYRRCVCSILNELFFVCGGIILGFFFCNGSSLDWFLRIDEARGLLLLLSREFDGECGVGGI